MEDFFDDNADEDLLAAVEGPSKPLTNAQVILDTGVTWIKLNVQLFFFFSDLEIQSRKESYESNSFEESSS